MVGRTELALAGRRDLRLRAAWKLVAKSEFHLRSQPPCPAHPLAYGSLRQTGASLQPIASSKILRHSNTSVLALKLSNPSGDVVYDQLGREGLRDQPQSEEVLAYEVALEQFEAMDAPTFVVPVTDSLGRSGVFLRQL